MSGNEKIDKYIEIVKSHKPEGEIIGSVSIPLEDEPIEENLETMFTAIMTLGLKPIEITSDYKIINAVQGDVSGSSVGNDGTAQRFDDVILFYVTIDDFFMQDEIDIKILNSSSEEYKKGMKAMEVFR